MEGYEYYLLRNGFDINLTYHEVTNTNSDKEWGAADNTIRSIEIDSPKHNFRAMVIGVKSNPLES